MFTMVPSVKWDVVKSELTNIHSIKQVNKFSIYCNKLFSTVVFNSQVCFEIRSLFLKATPASEKTINFKCYFRIVNLLLQNLDAILHAVGSDYGLPMFLSMLHNVVFIPFRGRSL